MSLNRFLSAQERNYDNALSEIRSGCKKTHWMWYVFPQVKGLGKSSISEFYAIKDLQEARDYINHPVLGSRLLEISKALLKLETNDPLSVFGDPDHLKLRSCMTLFSVVAPNFSVFHLVLEKFFNALPDPDTLRILKKQDEIRKHRVL